MQNAQTYQRIEYARPFICSECFFKRQVSIEEITQLVMRAKSKCAPGIDGISYAFLKYPPVIGVLKELFQLLFDTGILPSSWRKAIICPILKDAQSDQRNPLNYRGISLLSSVSKLYTGFLNKRISKHLDSENNLADAQNGFRRNRSCDDHIFSLNSIIKNNKEVFSAFIDLRKAFDFVNRDMLLYKLLLYGIDGKVYNSVKSMHCNSSACIRINGKTTDWFDCKMGVVQGDCASPTLFSVFINDLVSEINQLNRGIQVDNSQVSILLYADNIVLVADSEISLQAMLDCLHN